MRVLLVDVDSKIPNLALMKISKYHKDRGDIVGFGLDSPDMAYISVIFRKNVEKAKTCEKFLKFLYETIQIDIGGPGYDLKKTLPPI